MAELQGLIIQNLWPATAGFIKKEQITQRELLETIASGVFTHGIIH